jgi:hypothetical protein
VGVDQFTEEVSALPLPRRATRGLGTRSTPPPAHLQPDHVRAVINVVHRSVIRLQAAEADRQCLTQATNGREVDDLYVAACHMTHAQRLARLAQLGERTDDLRLPEPAR